MNVIKRTVVWAIWGGFGGLIVGLIIMFMSADAHAWRDMIETHTTETGPTSTSAAGDSSANASNVSSANPTATSSSAGGAASNQGNTVAAGYNSDYNSLALALPGASPDYGSTAPCLESRRGWIFWGAGPSGKTATNEACVADQADKREHAQCMQMADRLFAWGETSLALSQLAECGSLLDVLLEEQRELTEDYATHEDVTRAFEASQTK